MIQVLKLYAAAAVVFFALDIAWLGYVARGIYARQMGHLTRLGSPPTPRSTSRALPC